MASIGMLGRFATSLVLWCLVHLHIELVRADDEVHATDLLQQKYLLHQKLISDDDVDDGRGM